MPHSGKLIVALLAVPESTASTDLAHEVGYGDASFFSRLFRRKVGLTPAQYRKRFKALRLALEQDDRAAPALAVRNGQRRAS